MLAAAPLPATPGEVLHEVQRQRRRAGLRGLRALLRAGAGRAGVQLGLEHALPRAHADACAKFLKLCTSKKIASDEPQKKRT